MYHPLLKFSTSFNSFKGNNMDDAFAKFMADRFRYLIDKINSQYFTGFFCRQKLDEALLKKLKRNMLIFHQVLLDNDRKELFQYFGGVMLDLESLLDDAVAESFLLSFAAKSQRESSISSEFTSLVKTKDQYQQQMESIAEKLEFIVKESILQTRRSKVQYLHQPAATLSYEDCWSVLKSGLSDLPYSTRSILAALMLSSGYLPTHLKLCFAACKIFPRGYEFEEEEVIRIWMAAGLLQRWEHKSMEEVGHEYFLDLTSSCFFQRSSAYMSGFVMRDLLHHLGCLAHFVSGDATSRFGHGQPLTVSRKSRNRRCLSSSFVQSLQNLESLYLSPSPRLTEFPYLARRLLDLSDCFLPIAALPDSIGRLKNFTKLRDSVGRFIGIQDLELLCLSHGRITKLPEWIGRLTKLRYLDLSHTVITRLPGSVGDLFKLETLILSNCSSLTELPTTTRKLINLHHLLIDGTGLKEMPEDMGRLTNLQTLSNFIVGKSRGYRRSQIEELGSLSNLRGTLHISELQNVVFATGAHKANLKDKKKLDVLEMEWGNTQVDSQNETEVLELLQPCKTLTRLSIKFFNGARFPHWLGDFYFSKMVFLRLSNCNNCLYLPPVGQLPSLENLIIEGMNIVERVGTEFCGVNYSSVKPFQSLKTLVFQGMLEWREWISPEGIEFPCLQKICIRKCPKLKKSLPKCLPSTVIEISECPKLEVTPERLPIIDDMQLYDVGKEEFESNEKLVDRPPRLPVIVELKSLDGNIVQLKSDDEFALQCSEHRTDVSVISHSSPRKSFRLFPENSSIKHEGAPFYRNSYDRSNRYDILHGNRSPISLKSDGGFRTHVSVISHSSPRKSFKLFPENSSMKPVGAPFYTDSYDRINRYDILQGISSPISLKNSEISQLKEWPSRLHSLKISECPMLKMTPQRLQIVNDMQLHNASKDEFESNEELVDRPPRLPVIEELKSLDSNVVQLKSADEFASQCSEHRTDVSITSHISSRESFTEDSSIKHEGASSDSDGDDLISIWYSPDSLHDISCPISLKVSEISQLEELPPRLHSLKISECPMLKMTPQRLQIVDDMQLHNASKDEFESNEELVDRPPRLPVIEELKSLDSNVVQLKSADEFALQRSEHRTDVSITSHISSRESFKLLPEDSSIKHQGASSDGDGDDLISIWYSPDSLHDIGSPISLKVSEISQLEELPPRLHSLKIEGCDALKSLPQEVISSSPHLQHLYIIDCCYLELFQEGHLPVALKSLYIRNCRKLDFLSLAETMHEHAPLEHLCMGSSCDSLRCFPLTFFPRLRSLSIWDSANFDSISITKNHMSLHAIEIRDCHKLSYFPKGGLLAPNLTSILLSNCKNLKVLPDQLYRLTSLQSLLINECPELDSIPEGGFPCSLDLLRITSCNKLTPCTEWGMNKLNNLSCFEIEGGCRDLESFPEEKLLPSNLNFLRISRASNLKFLDCKGLEHLKSLETLEINCCDKLRSLPEKDLPSSLTFLYIKDCPLLESKLQNKRGKEWCKISHIPNIQID